MEKLELYTSVTNQPVNCSVLEVGEGTPHVVMTAVQHGDEIIGLEAGLQALDRLNGRTIGKITLLTCLNPDGFHNQTREAFAARPSLNGGGANMNRQHPGDKNGTLPERIAANVDEYIQSLNPDVVIDLHAYAQQSVPHVILDHAPDETYATMHKIAVDSGLPWYLDFEPGNYGTQALDKALSAVWARRGVPAFTIELGPLGGFSKDQAERATEAVLALLGACGVTHPTDVKHPDTLAMANTLRGKEWQRVEIVSQSDASGYIRHLQDIGTEITKDDLLAEVVALDGTTNGKITAPENGVLFIWHNDPRGFPGAVTGVLLKER